MLYYVFVTFMAHKDEYKKQSKIVTCWMRNDPNWLSSSRLVNSMWDKKLEQTACCIDPVDLQWLCYRSYSIEWACFRETSFCFLVIVFSRILLFNYFSKMFSPILSAVIFLIKISQEKIGVAGFPIKSLVAVFENCNFWNVRRDLTLTCLLFWKKEVTLLCVYDV